MKAQLHSFIELTHIIYVLQQDSLRPSEVKSHKSTDSQSSDAPPSSVKFEREHNSSSSNLNQTGAAGTNSCSMSSSADDNNPYGNNTASRNQGNVRQDGGRLANLSGSIAGLGAVQSAYLTHPSAVSAASFTGLALPSQSSSEPFHQPNLLSSGHFSIDPLMDALLKRQMYPALPLAIPAQSQHSSLPSFPQDHLLQLSNQRLPNTSLYSDIMTADIKRERSPALMSSASSMYEQMEDMHHDRQMDLEVSAINHPKPSTSTATTDENDYFIAQRKRHASAPVESWAQNSVGKQIKSFFSCIY